jgi:hypothetical protein
MEEHLSIAAYDVQIQEMVISQLRAHHIGCVMVYLSARELHECIERTDAASGAWQRLDSNSRLFYHLEVWGPSAIAVSLINLDTISVHAITLIDFISMMKIYSMPFSCIHQI